MPLESSLRVLAHVTGSEGRKVYVTGSIATEEDLATVLVAAQEGYFVDGAGAGSRGCPAGVAAVVEPPPPERYHSVVNGSMTTLTGSAGRLVAVALRPRPVARAPSASLSPCVCEDAVGDRE
ncbi:hypothetical protein [Streptomyces sp. NPDC004685]